MAKNLGHLLEGIESIADCVGKIDIRWGSFIFQAVGGSDTKNLHLTA